MRETIVSKLKGLFPLSDETKEESEEMETISDKDIKEVVTGLIEKFSEEEE